MHLLLCLLSFVISTAHAIPAQFTHQGRLMEADGTPLEGEVVITFRLNDSVEGGSVIWEEALTLTADNGFYAAVLGSDEAGNPLDTEVLDQAPLWLEVQISGADAMTPRTAVNAVPYANMALVAEEVSGGPVDASEVAIAGTMVINGAGEWVGTAPSISWDGIEGMPADFADGVDDDGDSLADLGVSCLDGDVPKWDGALMEWGCGFDEDTTLTMSEVQTMVEAMSALALQAGATVDGSAMLTADAHGVDADAHHSSTSDGLDITPSSVTIQSTDTMLVDGAIDLGSAADDSLSAAMVQTLTGGGDADTLHTHAAAGGGGGYVEYVGVTTTLRAADATLEVMENDCAAAFGSTRMCTITQIKNSYPAPRPTTQSWVLVEVGNNRGISTVSSVNTLSFGGNFDGIHSRNAFYTTGSTNCTEGSQEGEFVTASASSSSYAQNSLPAVTVLPSGKLTRVSCDNSFTVACCGRN